MHAETVHAMSRVVEKIVRGRFLPVIPILIVLPVVRDLLFRFLAHVHQPFGDPQSFFHTAMEMLFMGIIGFVLYFLQLKRQQVSEISRYLESMVREKTREIVVTQEAAIEALATLAEFRDNETGLHLKRIQKYVRLLCEELVRSSPYREYILSKPSYIDELVTASILHDIGKTAIPDEILLKPGKLTSEEFEVMKAHTTIGGECLARANQNFVNQTGKESFLALARDIALYHHERWDGTGYPRGLRGEKIPLSARIVALCDAYDALTTDRVYRMAMTHQEAKSIIVQGRGSHFDPAIVEAFLQLDNRFDQIRQDYLQWRQPSQAAAGGLPGNL